MLIAFTDARRRLVYLNPHLVCGIELDEGGSQSVVTVAGGRIYNLADTPPDVAKKVNDAIMAELMGVPKAVAAGIVAFDEAKNVAPESTPD